jgi:hypothetical protein
MISSSAPASEACWAIAAPGDSIVVGKDAKSNARREKRNPIQTPLFMLAPFVAAQGAKVCQLSGNRQSRRMKMAAAARSFATTMTKLQQ